MDGVFFSIHFCLPFIQMAQMTQLDYLSGPKYFRLDQLEKETEFATSEELDNNKRFKLIQMRNEGVPEFKHLQMIPTDERFITDDVFEVKYIFVFKK